MIRIHSPRLILKCKQQNHCPMFECNLFILMKHKLRWLCSNSKNNVLCCATQPKHIGNDTVGGACKHCTAFVMRRHWYRYLSRSFYWMMNSPDSTWFSSCTKTKFFHIILTMIFSPHHYCNDIFHKIVREMQIELITWQSNCMNSLSLFFFLWRTIHNTNSSD